MGIVCTSGCCCRSTKQLRRLISLRLMIKAITAPTIRINRRQPARTVSATISQLASSSISFSSLTSSCSSRELDEYLAYARKGAVVSAKTISGSSMAIYNMQTATCVTYTRSTCLTVVRERTRRPVAYWISARSAPTGLLPIRLSCALAPPSQAAATSWPFLFLYTLNCA